MLAATEEQKFQQVLTHSRTLLEWHSGAAPLAFLLQATHMHFTQLAGLLSCYSAAPFAGIDGQAPRSLLEALVPLCC
jgi:hypothetical protein